MLVYIIVGSVREGRTAIKIANWLESKHPANTALPSDPISLNLVPT